MEHSQKESRKYPEFCRNRTRPYSYRVNPGLEDRILILTNPHPSLPTFTENVHCKFAPHKPNRLRKTFRRGAGLG